ncbi:THC0290_0291 family protein [Winogradskyella undariae]|uniref:THC0290_0291 family protein n=1 Tax=Winogradskyella undariae TaxID=1285465 RepID=UPI0015C91269|nr:glutamate dehydrogenase [Winogradskyella undariae]QNK77050.1 glutamate dehydrogenase [Winogradskyella sp. PAMC22761]
MKLKITKLLFPLALILSVQLSYSQIGFSNEIGIIAGPIAYQSDFGERYDFDTNSGNTGFGIGIVYYMNFDYISNYSRSFRNSYFRDHFKVRAELSWNKTTLNHYGQWADKDNVAGEKLRTHSGEAQNWNLGAQLEFYPMSLRSFSYGRRGGDKFAPFISLGAQYVAFNPSVTTTYGDQNINNANNFFPSWEPGSITDENGSTFSIVGSVGVRYKLTVLSDLMVDFRVQSFFDDKTDGLDHQLASNKTNDWLVWLNFGYIIYLD